MTVIKVAGLEIAVIYSDNPEQKLIDSIVDEYVARTNVRPPVNTIDASMYATLSGKK